MSSANIDAAKMQESKKQSICSSFLEAIQEFFSKPENQLAFEKWKTAQANK